MSTLLVWKDQIEKIYARYSFYIVKILQFVLGLCVFGLINSNIGFMKALSSTVCTVGLAAVTAFLPVGMLALVAALLVLVHLYALSLPVAGLCLAIFLVMYIFYVRFTPKKSWLVVVAAVAVALKVPYVIPVGKELLDGIMVFKKQIRANKEMWMMVVVLLLAMMVVYGVRTRGISHAWKTASVAGAIVAAVLQVSGCMTLDVSFQASFILLDLVVTVAAGLIAEFFFLSVDYSRTETLQFEDDEYYYYVKAVPKVGVTLPEKQVKHITEPHEEQPKEAKAAVNLKPEPMVQETVAIDTSQIQEADLEKNVDELLLTQSLNEELRQNQNEPEDDLSLTKSLGDLWTKKPGSGE